MAIHFIDRIHAVRTMYTQYRQRRGLAEIAFAYPNGLDIGHEKRSLRLDCSRTSSRVGGLSALSYSRPYPRSILARWKIQVWPGEAPDAHTFP